MGINATLLLKERLNEHPRVLQTPQRFLERNGSMGGYAVKMGLSFVDNVRGGAEKLVQLTRKITEATGPALASLGHRLPLWKAFAFPFGQMVEGADLLDIIGDGNYFFNGGYIEDRAKKKYHSIIGHIAFVPASISGLLLHAKDVFKLSYDACAASIGNIRVFGFAPRLAEAVKNWPLVRSIPNLPGKAATLANVRIFGFVTRLTLVTVARTCVIVGYSYFAFNAIRQQAKCQKKSREYLEKLRDRKIEVKPSDTTLKAHFEKVGIVAPEAKEQIGKDFVKYKNNLIKAKQAGLDKFAFGSEVLLRVPVLFGLAVGASVGANIALATLGAVSFLCIGRAAYNKFTGPKKVELKQVI